MGAEDDRDGAGAPRALRKGGALDPHARGARCAHASAPWWRRAATAPERRTHARARARARAACVTRRARPRCAKRALTRGCAPVAAPHGHAAARACASASCRCSWCCSSCAGRTTVRAARRVGRAAAPRTATAARRRVARHQVLVAAPRAPLPPGARVAHAVHRGRRILRAARGGALQPVRRRAVGRGGRGMRQCGSGLRGTRAAPWLTRRSAPPRAACPPCCAA